MPKCDAFNRNQSSRKFGVNKTTKLSVFDKKINQIIYCFFFDIHRLSVYFISITKIKNNYKKILNTNTVAAFISYRKTETPNAIKIIFR